MAAAVPDVDLVRRTTRKSYNEERGDVGPSCLTLFLAPYLLKMPDLPDERRTLGRTDLCLPKIVFGTAALGNVGRVMSDQAKLALCGEFLRQASSPIWIETSYAYGNGMAPEVLGRMLRRLEVAGNEVVIQLTVDAQQTSLAECWDKSCSLLGDEFRPKLVAIDRADDASLQLVSALKEAGDISGVGSVARDWHQANNSLAEFDPDFVMIRGCTVMRHPPDVLEFMADMATNQVPVVLSGVFEGGFLVGSNRVDGRALQAEDSSDRSLLAWRKGFVALCDGHGVSPSQACIRFALAAPAVVAVRLETSYADRVAQNVASIGQRLPDNFWQSMKEEGLLADSVMRCLGIT